MITVTRIYTFEAAHQLDDEFGQPANRLHGHTYTARITMPGGTRTEDTDAHWAALLNQFDHRLLNDVFEDTTVEGLASYLLDQFVEAVAVEVQEGQLRYGRAERPVEKRRPPG